MRLVANLPIGKHSNNNNNNNNNKNKNKNKNNNKNNNNLKLIFMIKNYLQKNTPYASPSAIFIDIVYRIDESSYP